MPERDCSKMWPLPDPQAGPEAGDCFPKPPPSRLTGQNLCSFWHKPAPLPCLSLHAASWTGRLSWPNQACKVTACTSSIHILVPMSSPFLFPIQSLVPAQQCWDPFHPPAAEDMPYTKFPLTNSMNHQNGVASLPSVFPCPPLSSVRIFSPRTCSWVHIYEQAPPPASL